MARLILLDRDGVINLDSPEFVKTPEEWQAIPGSLAAIADLKASGRRVAICSNQSGVARGIVSAEMFDAIEQKMLAELHNHRTELDLVLYCTHHPDDGCSCRKPLPGMLLEAMTTLAVGPDETCFVGDSLRDLQAAIAAGCRPVLVQTGNGNQTLDQLNELDSNAVPLVYRSLAEFARAELAMTQ